MSYPSASYFPKNEPLYKNQQKFTHVLLGFVNVLLGLINIYLYLSLNFHTNFRKS